MVYLEGGARMSQEIVSEEILSKKKLFNIYYLCSHIAILCYTFRLHVVHLWHPRPRLGREACLWEDPLHELQRLQAQV